jgi:DnaK suppressor protein
MIVSILQLMGFTKAKPVHSRAGETSTEHAQASSGGRQDVKAKSGKDAKAKAKAKKPSPKPVAKAAAKPVVKKPVGKTTAKPVVKPVPKAKAKPAPKPIVKSVAKPVPKAKAKPAPKVVAKKVAKPASKPVVKPACKAAVKPVAKPVSKAVVKKPVPQPASKAKVAPKAQAKPAPVSVKPKEKILLSASSTLAKPVAAPVVAAPVIPPAKAGRPSSRLASLTVPSMAQSVASTAAKASYTQSVPLHVIVPVLPSSVKKDPKLANNWKTKPVAELSDAELMAMPDSEYMNEVQLAAFRLKLAELKRGILSNAGETTEHLREDTSVVPDPADRATIEEEHALELRTRDRERKLLKKIEQSIGRIDAGDYGYCDETGEPIGVGRLLARPTATLSLEAQQRRELKQKMFGD